MSSEERERQKVRSVTNLIKVDVSQLDTLHCTPWRLELVSEDGTATRCGVAKAVGIDGSVGIQWDDQPADSDLTYHYLPQRCYRWLGPKKD